MGAGSSLEAVKEEAFSALTPSTQERVNAEIAKQAVAFERLRADNERLSHEAAAARRAADE